MWTRVSALIFKELLASIQDQETRIVVLILPPLLLLVYVFALTQEVKDVSMVVLNQDKGTLSRDFIARFEGSRTFADLNYVDTHDEVARAIENQVAIMALHIQSDFSKKVTIGEGAKVQLLLDGRRSNTAQILQGYVSGVVADFNAEIAAINGPPSRVQPSVVVARSFFNPNLDTIWSATPGLFAVLISTVGFMVSALSIARERELGTFEQLLVSPLKPLEILIGKTIPSLMIALASASAMLMLCVTVLNVPFEGSVLLLFLAMVMHLASIIGIGLFISALVSTQQQAIIGLFMYMVPAVLLSGYATPIENMPDWLQVLAETNPITHFIVICRGIFLKEAPITVILDHTWPLALIAVVTLSLAAWLFRHKIQ